MQIRRKLLFIEAVKDLSHIEAVADQHLIDQDEWI